MIRKLLGMHRWLYRNPFDRRCQKCGRHEVFHGFEAALTKQNGCWDVFDDGNKEKCKPIWRKV